jgi:hypothetical protein
MLFYIMLFVERLCISILLPRFTIIDNLRALAKAKVDATVDKGESESFLE